MSLFAVGRICLKIAGRDADQKCVIVERIDNTYVLVDGLTRRRKVNIRHLEPLAEVVQLSAGASHTAVVAAFHKLNIAVAERKTKKVPARSVRQKKKATVKVTEKKATEKNKVKKEQKATVKTEPNKEKNNF